MQASIGWQTIDSLKTKKPNILTLKQAPINASIGGIWLQTPSAIPMQKMQPAQSVQTSQPVQKQESLFDTYMQDANISKEWKFKMLSDVQSGRISEQDANEIISQIYKEPDKWLISRVWEDIGKRAGNIGQTLKRVGTEETSPLSGAIQITGNIAGGIGDIMGEALVSAYKVAWEPWKEQAKQLLNTDVGQKALWAIGQWVEAWDGFKQTYPDTARNIESVVNVASLLPITQAGKVTKPIASWVQKVWDTIKPIVWKITPDTQDIAQKVSTRANRFNAVDEENFIKQVWETPGEFAVNRGMTEVWENAVEKATKNFQESVKQADNAFEQIWGNYKYNKGGTDPVLTSLDDLEKRFSETLDDRLWNIQSLKEKYIKEGLTMPEINSVKREYANNFKYWYEDRNSTALARSSNIQNKLREWQFEKANEMWLENIRDINRNTKAWKMFADSLEKKINRSWANNSVSITDWISLSGGNASNIALFLGKKIWTSGKAKSLLIKAFWKKKKEAIIKPKVKNTEIKGLLPRWPIITPKPIEKTKINVTPSRVQPTTRLALPAKWETSFRTTLPLNDRQIIEQSKLPLKKTKYGTNNSISDNMSSPRLEWNVTKAKIVNPQKAVEKRLTPEQIQKVKDKMGKNKPKTEDTKIVNLPKQMPLKNEAGNVKKPKIVNNKLVPKSEVNKPVIKKDNIIPSEEELKDLIQKAKVERHNSINRTGRAKSKPVSLGSKNFKKDTPNYDLARKYVEKWYLRWSAFDEEFKIVKKSLDNKWGYINPSAIVSDITKAIKTLTPKNIYTVSSQISKKLWVALDKVQAILKEYVQKYGAELKDKAWDLFDDLADRLGVRSKLVDWKGTGISGKIDELNWDNIDQKALDALWILKDKYSLDRFEEARFDMKKQTLIDELRKKQNLMTKWVLREWEPKISSNWDTSWKLARERFNIPYLEKLWSGSDRDVYDLWNNQVLKVVKSARWLEQTAQWTDFYLQETGIIPKIFEQWDNYVVVEKVKQFKDMSKEERKIINDFISDMDSLRPWYRQRADYGLISERLEKYGWEDLANYDMDTFGWGDIRKANLWIKNRKPILIDEWTINLTQTIKNYTWVRNLDDPKFRDIYNRSKEIKRRLWDIDKNTMYNIWGVLIGGYYLNEILNDKQANK